MSTSFMSTRTRIDTVNSKGISFAPVSSSLMAFGFGPQSTASTTRQMAGKDTDSIGFAERIRRSSSLSRTRSTKGQTKNRISTSAVGYNADSVAAAHMNGSSSENSCDSSGFPTTFRPLTSEFSSPLKRSRGSILVQASDAINSRFGRKRKSVRQLPVPVILPDVIEICAPRHDEEVEERERLRDAAAQSIGLGPDMLQDRQSRDNSIEEVDEEQENANEHHGWGFEMLESPRTIRRFTRSSSISSMPVPELPLRHRPRSGSLALSLKHVRTRSTTPASSPLSFPTTPAMLKQSTVMAAILPKYHPPSSLLVFALAKQWKSRFIVLSSPVLPLSRGQTPSVSHLHLFKSSGSEERELERLEINEDSVVFVADEEAGGRKGVVKVGGLDVGAFKKEPNQDSGNRTMWLLQILDATEAQKWIAAIKTAILAQRSMRAGLGLPVHTLEENFPRGDMDVMLSMRAQGLISSPIPENANILESSDLSTQMTSPGPDSSLRSPQTTKSSPSGPVSALKGLFTSSTRPRSTSRATSIYLEVDTTEESFGTTRNNSLDVSQTNGTGEGRISPLSIPSPSRSPILPTLATPRASFPPTNIPPLDQRIDQQIISGHSGSGWSGQVDPNNNRHIHVSSVGPLSPLPPPPNRKPWAFHGPKISNVDDSTIYKHNNGNCSVACNFGLESSPIEERPPPSPTPTSTSFSTPEQRVRSGSLRSVSTVASVELGGRPKRWSRQGVLTKRLTPPSGPRPPITEAQNNPSISRLQTQYPYSGDRSSSPSSSYNSPQSGLTGSSKRESNSSAYSASTASTSQSRTNTSSRQGSFHRRSIPPPPRPAPNFAPPPPPSQPSPLASVATTRQIKTSFRDSVTRRGLKLSLSAPKPPPSTSLPPRPDEKGYRSHRRNSSNDNESLTPKFYPIPFSTIPPGPPPSGPLPPPPLTSSTPVSRHASIKQRLRILSAPSSTPSVQSLTLSAHATVRSPTPPTSILDPYASQPSTPIGEPITMDPSFSLFSFPGPTPSLHNSDRPRPLEPFPNAPELTSLSPPPRRGSRQISTLEKDKLNVETARFQDDDHNDSMTEEMDKPMSLSRRASFMSLGM